MRCSVDRFIQRELQPFELDLPVKVQRGGGSPIEQLIQSHSVVRSVGLVLTLLQLSLSKSELGADEIGLRRLARRVSDLGYVNDLLQVRDILGVDSNQSLIEQHLVVSGLNTSSQIAHRRLIR